MPPRAALAALQQRQAEEGIEARGRLMDTMLSLCGEIGYRRVTVERVYRRHGCSRASFYRHFKSKGDCFAVAYDRESERLAEQLISFGDRGRGEERLTEAFAALTDFVVEDPDRAKALFVEVHVAGRDMLEKRRAIFERLSHALDSACRENNSRHSAPLITGEFMINVIDQAVSNALVQGELDELPEIFVMIADLICQAYSGGSKEGPQTGQHG